MTAEAMAEKPATIPPTVVQKLAAEVIGTFVLVFIGCGSVVIFGSVNDLGASTGSAGIVNIGLSFGIAVVMMAYAFGRISGGHFNPAVSVGAALAGRISWKDAGLYTVAQLLGALAGGLVLAIVAVSSDFGWEFGDPLGSNGFGDFGGVGLVGALLIELVLTFIFLLVILGVTDERNDTVAFAPLAIGLTLAAIHFVCIPATGTSVNPARSIGVAFFSGGDAILQLWLFIVAPILGAVAAGLLYPLIFGHATDPVPGSGLKFGGNVGAPTQFEQQWNQQSYGQPVAGQSQDAPIIQDGWQWDPASQQWIPAQQPVAPQQPGAQAWAPPAGGDATQVRPPQG
jgi:aquaporin Z